MLKWTFKVSTGNYDHSQVFNFVSMVHHLDSAEHKTVQTESQSTGWHCRPIIVIFLLSYYYYYYFFIIIISSSSSSSSSIFCLSIYLIDCICVFITLWRIRIFNIDVVGLSGIGHHVGVEYY